MLATPGGRPNDQPNVPTNIPTHRPTDPPTHRPTDPPNSKHPTPNHQPILWICHPLACQRGGFNPPFPPPTCTLPWPSTTTPHHATTDGRLAVYVPLADPLVAHRSIQPNLGWTYSRFFSDVGHLPSAHSTKVCADGGSSSWYDNDDAADANAGTREESGSDRAPSTDGANGELGGVDVVAHDNARCHHETPDHPNEDGGEEGGGDDEDEAARLVADFRAGCAPTYGPGEPRNRDLSVGPCCFSASTLCLLPSKAAATNFAHRHHSNVHHELQSPIRRTAAALGATTTVRTRKRSRHAFIPAPHLVHARCVSSARQSAGPSRSREIQARLSAAAAVSPPRPVPALRGGGERPNKTNIWDLGRWSGTDQRREGGARGASARSLTSGRSA